MKCARVCTHTYLPQGKGPTEKHLNGDIVSPEWLTLGGQTKGHPRLWKGEVSKHGLGGKVVGSNTDACPMVKGGYVFSGPVAGRALGTQGV